MANFLKTVTGGIAKAYRWVFDFDSMSVDPTSVSRTGGHRR